MANIEYRGNNKWRITKDYNGQRYRLTIDSAEKPKKKDAELIINNVIQDAIQKGEAQARLQPLTVKMAAEKYISAKENSLSPSTVRGYKTYLKNMPEHFTNTLIADVTEEQIQQLVKEYQQEKSIKYTKNIIGLIRSVLGMFRKNFSFKVTFATAVKEEPYIPTAAEVKQIIERSKGTQYELAIMMAACCGMRRGEILAITAEDLEANNVLHINKAMAQNDKNVFVLKNSPKTKGSVRDIVVPDQVADLLRKQGAAYSGHPNAIIKWLEDTEKALDIPKFTFHKLRHYYCTTLHENGIPDAVIMKLGGWTDPGVMQRIYRHGRNDLQTMTNAATLAASGLF